MVKRSIVAAILTAFVFLSGLSFGLWWDELRKSKLREQIDELTVYSSALFIESQLLPKVKCEAMGPLIEDAIKDISRALEDYEAYMKNSRMDLDRQRLLYRRYLLANIRYWMFAEKYKKDCGANYSIILFFFEKDCRPCVIMADRLTYMKKKYGNSVLICPINMYFAREDPVAHTLREIYNVTEYPTLIIENKKYGVLSKEELEELICKEIHCYSG